MDNQKRGHRNRVRKRIIDNGIEEFQDYELLEFLLFYAIPLKDTKGIAKELLLRFKSISGVFEASYADLCIVHNMTKKASRLLTSMPKLCIKYLEESYKAREQLSAMSEILNYTRLLFEQQDKQRLYMIAVDSQGKLIEKIMLSDDVNLYERACRKKLLITCQNLHSTNIYLVSNRLNDDCTPTPQEKSLYQMSRNTLEVMDILLVDYLIYSPAAIYSFRNESKKPNKV